MKILYVAASPVPSKAANSVHVVKMAQALAHNNHIVTLVAPTPSVENAVNDIERDVCARYDVEYNFQFSNIKLYSNKFGQILFSLRACLKFIAGRYDFMFTRCLPTAFLAACFFIPVIYERHSDFGEGRNLNKLMYRSLTRLPSYKGTVVVSEALKKFFIEYLDAVADKVIVAADGSDPIVDKDYPSPFVKSGEMDIGYIGHLYKGRGIEVIADIAKHHQDCKFHIVGGNPEDTAYWKNEYCGITNLFFYGHVDHAVTKDFMMNFDILLAPYQKKVQVAGGGNTEKWMSPLKIFEYMSSGIPFICSDIAVLREVLGNKRNCLLCAPDVTQEWIDAVDLLKNNQQLRADIGRQAREEFLANYTWKTRASNIVRQAFKITG